MMKVINLKINVAKYYPRMKDGRTKFAMADQLKFTILMGGFSPFIFRNFNPIHFVLLFH